MNETAAPGGRQPVCQDLISGPGERIPSERQLAELLGKSRMTVRKAIDGSCAPSTIRNR